MSPGTNPFPAPWPWRASARRSPITIHSEQFIVDMHTINLHGYELVLGCDWLRTLGPVLWD
jgi:hypothetical protein